jgi:hypothetical protein
MRTPRKTLALALTGLVVGLAACGGDDEKTSSGSSSDAGSSEPAKLAITASGTPDKPVFEVASESPAGLTEITFTNDGKGEIDGQLVRIEGDHAVDAVVAELEKAQGGKPIQDWFQAKGGVGSTPGGETGTVTQVLEPGTYYVVGGNKPPEEPASFEVTGEASDAKLPAADGGKLGAGEYSFFGSPVTSGAPVEFDNTGKQWHHFIALQLIGDATIDDAKAFFKNEGKGKPPFDEKKGFDTSVMDGGVSQVVDNPDLQPGNYVLVCFLSDREGGPPHFTKGMVAPLEVK